MTQPLKAFNPLLCSPSPRDIREVEEALKGIGYDILYAKYYPIEEAAKRLKQYFLEHEEYTHFIWCPDDLMVTQAHLDKLEKTLQEKNYPILSGVCNVDTDENKLFLSITKNLPHPTRINEFGYGWRYYHWYHVSEVKGIMKVNHSGNACGIFRRDIMEKLPFQDDSKFNADNGRFGSVDVMISNMCAHKKIPIMVDTDVKMLHMRHSGQIDITIGDGFMKFIKNT